ncbi:MAG: type I methionyl aminopeptidase [Longimicrobiales bacterium]
MSIETERDRIGLERAGRVVARILARLSPHVRAGITTAELDGMADEWLAADGARSAPRHVYGFPGAICISLNEEAVHGIPSARRIKPGDLVTLDVTAELDGYYADAAVTLAVAPVSAHAKSLRLCAEAAFWKAMAVARAGVMLREIGRAVEAEVRRRGFHVLRDLAGHGIGRTIHEKPAVFNYADARDHAVLSDGLVITIEPIVAASTRTCRELPNGWTVASADHSMTAHFEHTVVIGFETPRILTV